MPDLDAEKINALLDLVIKTKDSPAHIPINQAAVVELGKVVKELQDALAEEREEAKKAAEEEAEKRREEEAEAKKEKEDA